MSNIRTLHADEIECRAAQVKKGKNGVGCSLLLYKDARCDMRILDEVFGSFGWERKHEVIDGRLYCTVSVLNPETGEWVDKQDVGTESNTEKEKGQASDSFKRACFNWGIGRELYSAPFIWITLSEGEYTENNGRYILKSTFCVREIAYNDKREIVRLVITDRNGKERFSMGGSKEPKKTIGETQCKALHGLCSEILGHAATKGDVYKLTGYSWSDIEKMSVEEWQFCMESLNKKVNHDA